MKEYDDLKRLGEKLMWTVIKFKKESVGLLKKDLKNKIGSILSFIDQRLLFKNTKKINLLT